MIDRYVIGNIDKLTHEQRVDILVAQHLFEWKEIIVSEHVWNFMGEGGVSWFAHDINGNHVPCFSKLLTSAWDVVRKFEYIYLFHSKDFKGGQWEVKLVYDEWKNGTRMYAWAPTAQLAICYAGLKAVGFDVKSFLKEEGKI